MLAFTWTLLIILTDKDLYLQSCIILVTSFFVTVQPITTGYQNLHMGFALNILNWIIFRSLDSAQRGGSSLAVPVLGKELVQPCEQPASASCSAWALQQRSSLLPEPCLRCRVGMSSAFHCSHQRTPFNLDYYELSVDTNPSCVFSFYLHVVERCCSQLLFTLQTRELRWCWLNLRKEYSIPNSRRGRAAAARLWCPLNLPCAGGSILLHRLHGLWDRERPRRGHALQSVLAAQPGPACNPAFLGNSWTRASGEGWAGGKAVAGSTDVPTGPPVWGENGISLCGSTGWPCSTWGDSAYGAGGPRSQGRCHSYSSISVASTAMGMWGVRFCILKIIIIIIIWEGLHSGRADEAPVGGERQLGGGCSPSRGTEAAIRLPAACSGGGGEGGGLWRCPPAFSWAGREGIFFYF